MLGTDHLSLLFSTSHMLVSYPCKLKRCNIGGFFIVANTKETLTLLGVVKYFTVLEFTNLIFLGKQEY